ncbi:MAG TPA: hypothetical protein VMM37_03085, partial [Bacteroidota bacterium]|nr:hypothetical protein [Bacteroidota bacterium]
GSPRVLPLFGRGEDPRALCVRSDNNEMPLVLMKFRRFMGVQAITEVFGKILRLFSNNKTA